MLDSHQESIKKRSSFHYSLHLFGIEIPAHRSSKWRVEDAFHDSNVMSSRPSIWPPRAICSQSQWAAGFMSYSQQTLCVCVAGKGKSSCCLFSSNILICSSNTANLMKPQMQFVKHFSSLMGKTMWMLREIAKDGADSFIFTWSHRCVDLINTPDSQSLPKQTSKNIYKLSYTNIIIQTYLSS